MAKDKVPVNAVEKVGNQIHLNPGADAANLDPIRAARLLKEGKEDKLQELHNTPVYDLDEDDIIIEES